MRGNPAFEEFAKSAEGKSRFTRVVFTPWTTATSDPFAKEIGLLGLPIYVTYRDGKPVRRKVGYGPPAELQKDLLDGIQ